MYDLVECLSLNQLDAKFQLLMLKSTYNMIQSGLSINEIRFELYEAHHATNNQCI